MGRPIAGADDRAAALALMSVSRETEERLARFVDELRRWQAVKNLVGPATLDRVWTRHIADSAQLVALAPQARRWLDLGSGAGFPGLVVAILLADTPGAQVDLVESNGRKCAFLRAVSRATGAPARVHNVRIEDVIPEFVGKVDVVSARALAPLTVLLGMTKDLLRTGTLGLFPKGQDLEVELTEASKSWRIQADAVASKTDPQARILVVRELSERQAHD
ncbi:16S rRNA (guanine(527)-N(7))-methyltransferase RsmG [Chelatococcus sp. SYSU_G07232]|uniref:Ribosomal RNA small subunit methyltransferase G n=1 Tax=Chelatococcus albus TaxID=3047466 RepID=A0ABT7AHZ1_9HYPH|nr:16S rRNA (guanine(527)-N(7))-methyltransferase RsmG [Chelatococcus sp. SYSU_G07232]MDJ1158710.1 16S rRNA (guanine(527)-N(7))-methyltransferase RsmG [Chelatococcus sp. SYSU_G07232]